MTIQQTENCSHLSVLPNRIFNLMEVGSILGQDVYELQKALDYKIVTRSEPVAVLTELIWVVSGPIKGNKRTKCLSFRQHERRDNDNKHSIPVAQRYLCFQNTCCKSIKETATSSEFLRERDKIYSPAVRSGHALESTSTQSSKQLRLIPRSALLTGKMIPKRPKFERIVSTVS